MMKIIFPQKNQIEFQIWSNCGGVCDGGGIKPMIKSQFDNRYQKA